MSDLFKDLNERQIEAVTTTEGYCRVIAGAGSGKTKTLTHRFAYLVTELGISARNILCVTFTNKAANEMKSRVKRLLGDGYDSALITTYHGFCVRVLKEDIYKIFFPANFKILDVGAQKKILEEIYAEYEIKLDYSSFEKALEFIYKEKTHLEYIPLMTDPAYIFNPENAMSLEEKIYIKYLARQKKIYGLDFNDLIYFTIYLFEHHEDVIEKWQDRLHYIQVDEFQDSSKKELDIINALCKKHNNLFVVGDPDQNIYEWRNSENRFLVHFDKNYPNVNTIILNQNYRSTPEILAVSNSLIEKNKNRVPKDLFTLNPPGKKAGHIHLKSEAEESGWIISKINELLEVNKCLYSDIAILYRSSHVSRFIEQLLTAENVPYVIHGGVRFFDRMEIKDSIAFLKLAAGNDDEAFLRVVNVPKRQMGKFRIDALKEVQKRFRVEKEIEKSLFEILRENIDEDIFANTQAREFIDIITAHRKMAEESNITISDLLNSLLERTGYKKYISMSGDMERFDNVTELLASITEFEQQLGEDISLNAYLQQLSVISDYESERNKNCVKLMTIHASKGLEFPYVIIAGMTEGIFPSWRSLEERKEEGLEEERRLCYVAMTRAMFELYMTESEGKTYGEIRKLPSRFLFDIEPVSIEMTGTIPEEIIKDLSAKINKKFPSNLSNLLKSGSAVSAKFNETGKFKAGDMVSHKFFGEGEIVGIDIKSDAYLIKFANLDNAKPISRDYAGLTLLGDAPLIGELIEDTQPVVKHTSNFNKKMDKVFESRKTHEALPFKPSQPAKISQRQPQSKLAERAKPNLEIKFPKMQKSIKTKTTREPDYAQIELLMPDFEKEIEKEFESEYGAKFESRNEADIDIYDVTADIQDTDSIDNIESIENVEVEYVESEDIDWIDKIDKTDKIDKIDRVVTDKADAIVEMSDTGEVYDSDGEGVPLTPPNMPKSLYEAEPQILYDNSDRVNLWNDPSIPKKGWVCVDVIDLGYPSGQCGMCGKEEIRYVHIMNHEEGLTIGAGCVCAGNMEGNVNLAKERENSLKNKINRFRTFFNMKLKTSSKGNLYTTYKETLITFLKDKNNENGWKFVEGGEFSNSFTSLEDAKVAAFMKIDARR